ncbi:MAG: hypothetical protein D6732_16530 [Methanobacteriota archaeon]|nr:MAG: hypothetical protein D6732_16530 [Euryarchaeota archaeon]
MTDAEKQERRTRPIKVVEFAFSRKLDMGYCILETEKEKVTSIAYQGGKIHHHCRHSPKYCTHIRQFLRLVEGKSNSRLHEQAEILHEHPWQVAMEVAGQLLIEGEIENAHPLKIIRAHNAFPDSRLGSMFLKNLLSDIKLFLGYFFEIVAVLNYKKKGGNDLFEIHCRQVTSQILKTRLMGDILPSTKKFYLDLIANRKEDVAKHLEISVTATLKDMWKMGEGKVAELAFKLKAIRRWFEQNPFDSDTTTFFLEKIEKSLKSYKPLRTNESRKWEFLKEILDGRPLDKKLFRRAVRRIKNIHIRRYFERLEERKKRISAHRVSFDDFFIYLMEKRGERPIYDFPIRRYHERIYLPKQLLDANPTLKFILKRIAADEYLTYDEVKAHLKFFKWMAGEHVESRWRQSRRLRKKLAAIWKEGEIFQVDFISTVEWGDQFVLKLDDRQLLLEPEQARQWGIEPFDFILCNTKSSGDLDIQGLIELDDLEQLVVQGRRIRSEVLPWHLVNGDQLPAIDDINRAIRVASRRDFVLGSDLLVGILEKMAENGKWIFESDRFAILRHQMHQAVDKEEKVRDELADQFLLFLPPSVQRGLEATYGDRKTLLKAIFHACLRQGTFEQVLRSLAE